MEILFIHTIYLFTLLKMEILFIHAVYLFIGIHLFKNNRNIKRLLFDILSLFLILMCNDTRVKKETSILWK